MNEHYDAKRATSITKISTAQQSTNISSKDGGLFPYIRHEEPQLGTYEVSCSLHPCGTIALTQSTLAQVARDGSCMLIHTLKVTEKTSSTNEIWNAPCFTASYKIADTSPLLLEEMYKDLQYVRIHPGIQQATLQYLIVVLSRPWCMAEIVLSYSGILESILETLNKFDGGVYSQPIAVASQVAEALTNPELDQNEAVARLVNFFKQAKLVSFKEQWWRLVLEHLTRIRTVTMLKSTVSIGAAVSNRISFIERYSVDNKMEYEPLQ